MSHRQKNKHKPRHSTHAVKPENLPTKVVKAISSTEVTESQDNQPVSDSANETSLVSGE